MPTITHLPLCSGFAMSPSSIATPPDRFCVSILADIGPDGKPRPTLNLKVKSCNLLCDEGEQVDDDVDSAAVEAALKSFSLGAACSTRHDSTELLS